MAKTKAMCIIKRSTKLIAIQHEKKHGKGSKNSSTYFDNRIDLELGLLAQFFKNRVSSN